MLRNTVTAGILFFFLFSGSNLLSGHNDYHDSHHRSGPPARKTPSLKIMSRGKIKPEDLTRFLYSNNSKADTIEVKRLVKCYIAESNREGVNYEVAFCQMCLETGFLRFEGSVSRYQNNFCGLGCVDIWSSGDWFVNMQEGIRAHIQHLKAYASIEPVKSPLVDPRFSGVKRGSVVTVKELTGKWAADPEYGKKIADLIYRLHGK